MLLDHLCRQGKHEEALSILNLAIEQNPHDVSLYLYRYILLHLFVGLRSLEDLQQAIYHAIHTQQNLAQICKELNTNYLLPAEADSAHLLNVLRSLSYTYNVVFNPQDNKHVFPLFIEALQKNSIIIYNCLTFILKVDPSNAIARLYRSIAQEIHGRHDEWQDAHADFKEAMQSNPEFILAAEKSLLQQEEIKIIYLLLRGTFYLQQCRLMEAIEDFTQVLALDPKSTEAYEKRAETYLAANNNAAAIHDLKCACELQPRCTTAQIRLLEIYVGSANLLEAIAHLQQFISCCRPFFIPMPLHNRYLLAVLQLKIPNHQAFFMCIRQLPDKAQEDHIDKLKEQLEEMVKLRSSDRPEIRGAKVTASMQMLYDKTTFLYQLFWLNKHLMHATEFSKRPRIFKEGFENYLSKFGSHTEYMARGHFYQKMGKGTLAIADYTRSLKTDPHNPEIYHCRGALYSERGKVSEALADLHIASQLEAGRNTSTFLMFSHPIQTKVAKENHPIKLRK